MLLLCSTIHNCCLTGYGAGCFTVTIRFKNELLLIIILIVLLIVIITLLQDSILRIILGLPCLLFFPGYTLLAALFPRRTDLNGIELVALSFGLSLAVVACAGLILNYTHWGIRLYPILTSLTAFIIVASIIAWARRRSLSEEEKTVISFSLNWPPWRGRNGVDKILPVILMVAVLGTVGSIGYVMAVPKEEERFTEFYVLGPEGKAEGYPDELTVGEQATVVVGIVNHEHEDVSYRLEITIDENKHGGIDQIALVPEEKWEREISFTPVKTGEKQKVEFVLYKDGEPYRRLNLWVDVKELE